MTWQKFREYAKNNPEAVITAVLALLQTVPAIISGNWLPDTTLTTIYITLAAIITYTVSKELIQTISVENDRSEKYIVAAVAVFLVFFISTTAFMETLPTDPIAVPVAHDAILQKIKIYFSIGMRLLWQFLVIFVLLHGFARIIRIVLRGDISEVWAPKTIKAIARATAVSVLFVFWIALVPSTIEVLTYINIAGFGLPAVYLLATVATGFAMVLLFSKALQREIPGHQKLDIALKKVLNVQFLREISLREAMIIYLTTSLIVALTISIIVISIASRSKLFVGIAILWTLLVVASYIYQFRKALKKVSSDNLRKALVWIGTLLLTIGIAWMLTGHGTKANSVDITNLSKQYLGLTGKNNNLCEITSQHLIILFNETPHHGSKQIELNCTAPQPIYVLTYRGWVELNTEMICDACTSVQQTTVVQGTSTQK